MFGALLGAGASIIGGVLGGRSQRKAAQAASSAQQGMSREAIAEQQRQFDAMQKLLNPYVTAGNQALTGQQDLLGLNGNPAQQQAIASIENSPFFKSQYQQAEDAIRQNAAATGGLRGGNIQEALADNRSNMLYANVMNQNQNLAALTGMGANAAAGVGNAGLQTAAAVGNQLNGIGQAQAGYQLARGQANQNMLNGLFQGAGAIGQIGQQQGWF
ncbi:hypothetical protein [Psychrobacter pygoscelis]|uniref:hypothetical protein n=1 Tax=Psychrobacter pygoscelis TaxID=2488563 RepID=UPI00103C33F1|nr:hypothetical protein [Psychrobacter pygoscelis]